VRSAAHKAQPDSPEGTFAAAWSRMLHTMIVHFIDGLLIMAGLNS